MTKVNPNNANKTKSDIFSWEIFKSDHSHKKQFLMTMI